ncbi:hypothetical protein EMIHUDRAFT_241500, partial [Emiliania huxleyi CCMP1516]|uniref:Homeobox domain-containing protein n=2 Tax=Emiliania huxleyi TaxID=2903 RepID=A0A0D3JCK0_EMIH1
AQPGQLAQLGYADPRFYHGMMPTLPAMATANRIADASPPAAEQPPASVASAIAAAKSAAPKSAAPKGAAPPALAPSASAESEGVDEGAAAALRALAGAGAGLAADRWQPSAGDVMLLERVFEMEPLPCRATREQLATHFSITSRQVQVWFQNKRQRVRVRAARDGESALDGLVALFDPAARVARTTSGGREIYHLKTAASGEGGSEQGASSGSDLVKAAPASGESADGASEPGGGSGGSSSEGSGEEGSSDESSSESEDDDDRELEAPALLDGGDSEQ